MAGPRDDDSLVVFLLSPSRRKPAVLAAVSASRICTRPRGPLAGREGFRPWRMKTRSQTGPKPLKTVALAPRPSRSPKPKASGKGQLRAPKKPPTAFFYFMEDFRKTYKKENPSVITMQEVGKACGEKWNTMPFEEKVKYYDIATEKRAEFEKAMAEYNKKKDSEELSDDD